MLSSVLSQALKTRTLPTLKFLWLILQHVLPKELQLVRDYGFLQGNAKAFVLTVSMNLHVLGSRNRPRRKANVIRIMMIDNKDNDD